MLLNACAQISAQLRLYQQCLHQDAQWSEITVSINHRKAWPHTLSALAKAKVSRCANPDELQVAADAQGLLPVSVLLHLCSTSQHNLRS